MNGIAEIDKSGRMVVPKKIRDAMGVRAGDSLNIELNGDEMVVRSQPRGKGLHKDHGLWVYDSGVPLTTEDVNRWVAEDRERQMHFAQGQLG